MDSDRHAEGLSILEGSTFERTAIWLRLASEVIGVDVLAVHDLVLEAREPPIRQSPTDQVPNGPRT
jgi:hypothetical protein